MSVNNDRRPILTNFLHNYKKTDEKPDVRIMALKLISTTDASYSRVKQRVEEEYAEKTLSSQKTNDVSQAKLEIVTRETKVENPESTSNIGVDKLVDRFESLKLYIKQYKDSFPSSKKTHLDNLIHYCNSICISIKELRNAFDELIIDCAIQNKIIKDMGLSGEKTSSVSTTSISLSTTQVDDNFGELSTEEANKILDEMSLLLGRDDLVVKYMNNGKVEICRKNDTANTIIQKNYYELLKFREINSQQVSILCFESKDTMIQKLSENPNQNFCFIENGEFYIGFYSRRKKAAIQTKLNDFNQIKNKQKIRCVTKTAVVRYREEISNQKKDPNFKVTPIDFDKETLPVKIEDLKNSALLH